MHGRDQHVEVSDDCLTRYVHSILILIYYTKNDFLSYHFIILLPTFRLLMYFKVPVRIDDQDHNGRAENLTSYILRNNKIHPPPPEVNYFCAVIQSRLEFGS